MMEEKYNVTITNHEMNFKMKLFCKDNRLLNEIIDSVSIVLKRNEVNGQ